MKNNCFFYLTTARASLLFKAKLERAPVVGEYAQARAGQPAFRVIEVVHIAEPACSVIYVEPHVDGDGQPIVLAQAGS